MMTVMQDGWAGDFANASQAVARMVALDDVPC